jgi:hypothetical protein
MAKVLEVSHSLVFTNLSAAGIALVDAFVTEHRRMNQYGTTPGQRTIEWSTPEQEASLKALAKKVEATDPE